MKSYAKQFQNWKELYGVFPFVLIVISALLLSGCKATRVQTSVSTNRIDSVVIRETLRDTVVTIKADSSLVRALLECDSLGQVRMRELVEYRAGERLKPPRIVIRNNELTASASVDSTAIYLQLKDRYEERISQSDKKETITIEVNRLTWWQKLWVRAGQILASVAAAYIIFRIIKLKISK